MRALRRDVPRAHAGTRHVRQRGQDEVGAGLSDRGARGRDRRAWNDAASRAGARPSPAISLEQLAPSIVDDEELRSGAHASSAPRRQPRRGGGADTDERDDRHPTRAARDSRADARAVPRRRGARREASRYLGERIPGATIVELPGADHMPWLGDQDAAARRDRGVPDRASGPTPRSTACSRRCSSRTSSARPSWPPTSATVAGATCSTSTTRSSAASSSRFRGQELNTAGDGFLATFDGPARAVACAMLDRGRRPRPRPPDSIRPAHGRARARRIGDHVASPCTPAPASQGLAGPGEVLTSSTVRDLVAGSGLEFEDRGLARAEGRAGRVAPVRRHRLRAPANQAAERLPAPRWG